MPAHRRTPGALRTLALVCAWVVAWSALAAHARPAAKKASSHTAAHPATHSAPRAAATGRSGSRQATRGRASSRAPVAAPVPRLPTVSAFRYEIAPAPDWVIPVTDAPQATAAAALHDRLLDQQVRLGPQGSSRYTHVIRVVDNPAGMAPAAQIEVTYDPSYQKLWLHHVDVVRNGQHLARLDRKQVQLLQRETQLEHRVYDGRVTASIVLDDVRVGDEVDYAYTLEGDNPVFGGRFQEVDWLGALNGPASLVQYRLIHPAQRTLQVRVGPTDARVSRRDVGGPGGSKWREVVVRRDQVPMLRFDTNASHAVALASSIQVSEFSDWGDVARWGARLFAAPVTPTPQIDRLVDDLRAAHTEPDDQVLAALKWVQTEVRYFGHAFGTGSHQPTSPEKVLNQRYGDCKDKALLFVTLLRKLGVQARPVLVSTQLRQNLDRALPGALAFDHVVTEVQLDDQRLVLDPTRTHQSGPLAQRNVIGLMRGLPLSADTTELAALPQPFDQLRFDVLDRYAVHGFAEDVTLESRITYRGDLAEALREALSTQAPADVEASLMQPYLRAYPQLQKLAPMKIEPATDDDAVTAVLQMRLPEFWRFPDEKMLVGDTFQWALIEAARLGLEPHRTDDLAVPFPGIHRHRVEVSYPEDVNQPGDTRVDEPDRQLALHRSLRITPREVQLDSEVVLGQADIPVGELPAYQARFNKLVPYFGLTLNVPAVPAARLDSLHTELAALEQDVRRQRIEATTPTQVQALFKLKVLDAQIASGRLTPRLKAQALVSRGIQHDMVGQLDAGGQDFAEALRLVPELPEALSAAARNAVLNGQAARARELASRLLARQEGHAEARMTRAMAAWQLGDAAATRQDLQRLLQDPAQQRQGYPLIWLSLTEPAGTDTTTLQRLTTGLPDGDTWPRPLVDWALGQRDELALLAAAGQTKASQGALCEAHFYLGERARALGDLATARRHYQAAVDQHMVEYTEHAWAVLRLRTLDR